MSNTNEKRNNNKSQINPKDYADSDRITERK